MMEGGVFGFAYRLGYGDGLHDAVMKGRDSFWSGVAVGLSFVPIAVILVLAWKTFTG